MVKHLWPCGPVPCEEGERRSSTCLEAAAGLHYARAVLHPSMSTMARARSSMRLLVRAEGGVLVEAYRYSAGAVEPLERHFHDAWQLAWSPDAVGEHWVRGAVRAAPPRAVSIIPPGEVHAPSQQTWLAAPESYRMAYLDEGVVTDVAAELPGRAPGTPSFGSGVIGGDADLSRLFARAHSLSLSGEPLERDVAWLALVTRLLTRHAASRQTVPAATSEPRPVARAMELLRSRRRDRITLAELARAASLSPARLCRAFARHVGLPPHAYQLRLRVEDAKQLLLQGQPVAEVAAATGFADQSHLGRHFKRIVGTTPSTYRSAAR
jgi:AraC-like DNA-binding protein